MITFEFVRWKNFLSTGSQFTEIRLDRTPTTLIVGENGAGKSTILDALCFGLFGKPYRNINKGQLINSINGKDCLIEVQFKADGKTIKIVRGIKPNVFDVFLNGELVNQNATVKDYQEMLETQILKLNHKSFTQIVILGTASFTPFMQLSAQNRREIIEDILDIQVFSTMNQLLKSKMNDTTNKIFSVEKQIELEKQKIELQKSHIDSVVKERKSKVAETEAAIEKSNLEIEVAQKQIDLLVKQIEDESSNIKNETTLNKKLSSIALIQDKLKTNKKKLSSEVSFYHENSDCPTCKQGIDQNFRDSAIRKKTSQITQIDDATEKLLTDLNDIESQLKKIRKVNQRISDLNDKLREYNNTINAAQKYINRLQAELRSSQAPSDNTIDIVSENEKLSRMTLSLSNLHDEKVSLRENQEYQSICAHMLKDNGIKTKIIRQYLPTINKLVNKYLMLMDFFVHFELDESFSETIKSRHRDEFSYASFSEGEKQRIDLALLFTWRNIAKLKNSANTNLLILDEVFDSSLDGQGIDFVMGLLNEIGKDSNVFVISHKGDQMFDKFRSVIRFEKKQNFSVISTSG